MTKQERELKDALERAAQAVGSKRKLGKKLGLSNAAVYFWRYVPEHQLSKVAELSGIPARELRPDLAKHFE